MRLKCASSIIWRESSHRHGLCVPAQRCASSKTGSPMLAILADIHGNFPAMQAVLNRIDQLGCKRIISLGDVAGYYAQPNECIDALRARKILNLMGNHDHYLVTGSECPRSR